MTPLATLLRHGTGILKDADIPGAERDARRLLAHVLGIEAAQLSAQLQSNVTDAITGEVQAAFTAACRRRATHEPLSHILGYRDFWTHRFAVTKDVLDPRPETETLIYQAISGSYTNVLDLGTGSGCILISLLSERPEARGVGTDISAEALLLAGENAARIGVADRLILPLSNWFDDIGGSYDLIVSNPPYIAADEMAGLARDVRSFEPEAALTDHADGLSAYRAIAEHAPNHLRPGGRLMVEIGPTQASDVMDLFAKAGLAEVTSHPDLDGRDRVVSARKTG